MFLLGRSTDHQPLKRMNSLACTVQHTEAAPAGPEEESADRDETRAKSVLDVLGEKVRTGMR